MHAYLISGGTIDQRHDMVREVAKKHNATLVTYDINKISDVRNLEKHTRLTLREKTAFHLKSIDEASEESQNALLKTLEEPQENALFILTVKREYAVLPTILSRCELLRIPNEELLTDHTISEFYYASVGEKLSRISKINDRSEALEFVSKLLVHIHNCLLHDTDLHDIVHNAKVVQTAYQNLSQNGNTNLQLSNLAIQMK